MDEAYPLQLAARCRNTQSDGSHEPFCFELFRRAVIEGCSLSWYSIHNCYYALVRYWISQRYNFGPDTTDDLVQDAFSAFWRFYTRDKLARANGLGDVLAYLKSCAASAAAQAGRQARKAPIQTEWDNHTVDQYTHASSSEVAALANVGAHELWNSVRACCNDERDHLVARLLLVAGLKPRHVAERHPDLFPDASDVHRIKRNLVDRLRRNPVVQQMHENWRESHWM